MSVKNIAVKSAKAALWPVKTPKRLVGWLFVGVAVSVFVIYGAVIMTRGPKLIAGAKTSLAGAYVRIAGQETAPEPVVSEPVAEPVAEPVPVPSPEWSTPKRLAKMIHPRDGCFKLAGLGHNLAKCWSHELWPGPHGVSRWLYYIDMSVVCETKRQEGLSCRN